jgi:lysine-specific histone demethylase 1
MPDVLSLIFCAAGLSAARQLSNHGYRVVVVEGSARPGGRVHTQRLEVSS